MTSPLRRINHTLVDSHLESCAFCRAEDFALHGLEDLLKRVSVVTPDEGFSLRVMERVREAELIASESPLAPSVVTFLIWYACGLCMAVERRACV